MNRYNKFFNYLIHYFFSFDFLICTILIAGSYMLNSMLNQPLRDVLINLSNLSVATIVLALLILYLIALMLLMSHALSPRIYHRILKKNILLLYVLNAAFIVSIYYSLSLFIKDNFILSTTNNIMLTSATILFLWLRFILIKQAIRAQADATSSQYQISILAMILTIKYMLYLILFLNFWHISLFKAIAFYAISFLIYFLTNAYVFKIGIINPYPAIHIHKVKKSIIWLSMGVIILSIIMILFQSSLNAYLLTVGSRLESLLSSPVLPTIQPK